MRTRAWSPEIAAAAGIDVSRFPPIRSPGTTGGASARFGAPVYVVGSHDTASAVAGLPAVSGDFAYISCGTWSLVGVELTAPVLTDASRAANFTNELGIDGTVRYLKNLSGLWLLQECLRAWGLDDSSLPGLLEAAARAPARQSVIDTADPRFLSPGDMPSRIAAACRDAGQPEPRTPPHMIRCILDSLAEAYRRAIGEAEATGLGNALVQARAAGALGAGLTEMRALIAATQRLRRYEPGARGVSG